MSNPYIAIPDVRALLGEIAAESIVSRNLYNEANSRAMLFGFAPGQELSEHTTPMAATIHILEGNATLTLGGDLERLDERVPLLGRPLGREELLDLDHALERFAEIDPRAAQVVELRFFAGLGMAEIAEALRVSKRTAEGDWTHARAWLKRELERPGDRGVPR